MPCFYCGKRVSIVRQLTDADFCSEEHRQKYHELTRMALNRLMESHEQVSAPARRKGKGQAAVKEAPPSLADRLEPPVEPAPRKHAPRVTEDAPPAPEKRQARPHRPAAPAIVTPPPPVRPDPPVAGYAQFPVAEYSPESAPQLTSHGGFSVGISESAPLLPPLRFAPLDDFMSAAAPEPAGLLAEIANPSRVPASPRIEPTPKRRPRPVIPRTAALPGGGLAPAELIPARMPGDAQMAGKARQSSAAAFELDLVLPSTGRAHASRLDADPAAAHAQLAPPAAAPGRLDAMVAPGAAELARDAVHLPRHPGEAAGDRVLPGHAGLESLPIPGVQAPTEPQRIFHSTALRFASATPSLPALREPGKPKGISAEQASILPGLPEAVRGPSKPAAGRADALPAATSAMPVLPDLAAQARKRQIGTGDFVGIGLPSPIATRTRGAQSMPGGMNVQPVAVPGFAAGRPATGSVAGVGPPAAVGLPRAQAGNAAPRMGAAAPTLTSPANLLMLSAVFLPALPARPSRHAVPESGIFETGVLTSVRKADVETCEAPLATGRMAAAGGIPVMLPRPVKFTARGSLQSAAEAPLPMMSGTGRPATFVREEWAALPLEWRIAGGPKHALARRRLGEGTIERPAPPGPKVPSHGAPCNAQAAFAVPETLRPLIPAKFDLRPPGVMPPFSRPPKAFAGTKPGPLASAAALPTPGAGLPAFESRIQAALGIGQRGPHMPGRGKARDLAAAPHRLAAPIRIEEIQPPVRPAARVPKRDVTSAGLLPQPAAAARNVAPRASEPLMAEFATASAAFGAQTPARSARRQLASGDAIPVTAGGPRPGAADAVAAGPAGLLPQPAELPRPQALAGMLRLGAAGDSKLQVAALAGAAMRQAAGWEALDKSCGSAEFGSIGSQLPSIDWRTVSKGSFAVEKAAGAFGGTMKPLPPGAVEMPALPVITPELAELGISLPAATAFRLDVHQYPDDRTAVRKAHLEPVFRKVRRPARLPVFGGARREKASMPQAIFIKPEEQDDFEDFSTMRIAPGHDEPCSALMAMPASSPRKDYSGKLPAAGLLQADTPAADRAVRAAAFGYRVPPIRPHLPDGWVDTVPVDFDPAAAEAAREANWEPIVGAIKNATRFFKFMCLGIVGLLLVSTLSIPEDPRGVKAAYQDSFGAGCAQQTLQAGIQ